MKYGAALIATVFALLLWQAVVLLTGLPRFILPGPAVVAEAWWSNRAVIAEHTLVTALEVLIGLLLGAALGVVTAIQLATSRLARVLVQPMLVFTQALPVFALAPILTLWMGYGLWSKVAMAVLIIYFPVTSAFFDGLMRTPRGYLDLAQTMQAGKRSVLWHIRVPAALPSLASGLRLAAVYAPIGAVIGEWVGASRGLGYLMLLANGRAKTDLMFAAMLTLGVFSVLLHLAVRRATMRMAGEH
ncbi:putative hydroxymethylpyrimidine transport system permease protein [Cribrihabitans marinus]|uniref:Putative hydroxymethylpyrimidine transport system permease protein n=1 Tax=Cribrihabitans marinus TaxID=1227549 RepID=A0A1H6YBD4_9RHOB|nr:ABC transporter permease [Cribrihabitans marinus]GGH28804.1 ABC transporter permease [Cribrihabitans marinus]SEJ37776.1 putative hydroxymethylpyrimidine transport system permease protein [Cribrihabitans marinus]